MIVDDAISQLQHFKEIHPRSLLLKGYDNLGHVLTVHALTLDSNSNIVGINMTVDPVEPIE